MRMSNMPFLHKAFILMLQDNVASSHIYKRILDRIQAQDFDNNYMVAEAELRKLTEDQLEDLCCGDQDDLGFFVTDETKEVLAELFMEIH